MRRPHQCLPTPTKDEAARHRRGDGETLYNLFAERRAIRRGMIHFPTRIDGARSPHLRALTVSTSLTVIRSVPNDNPAWTALFRFRKAQRAGPAFYNGRSQLMGGVASRPRNAGAEMTRPPDVAASYASAVESALNNVFRGTGAVG